MQDTQQRSNPVDGGSSKQNMVMSKLKESLFYRLSPLNPSISSINSSFLDQRLQQLINSFHAPTHPPYALMIQRAMRELNEKSGSTEEEIAEFIRREYEGLPLAHVRILDLHLRRLCLHRVIVCTKHGRYLPIKRRISRSGHNRENRHSEIW